MDFDLQLNAAIEKVQSKNFWDDLKNAKTVKEQIESPLITFSTSADKAVNVPSFTIVDNVVYASFNACVFSFDTSIVYKTSAAPTISDVSNFPPSWGKVISMCFP